MAELPADGFNLCDDCTKSLVSTFFLRLKANIRNWFSFGQKTN
jgi:hypothetical protein